MPINIDIEEPDLDGFNDQARTELKDSILSFSNDLIAESNRLESSFNTASNGPEITSSIVRDAKVLLRHKISKPKKSKQKIVIKLGASILSLAVGVMYDKELLQNGFYLILYILVIGGAILLTTLTILNEE